MNKPLAAPKTSRKPSSTSSDPDRYLAFMVEQRWPEGRVLCPICGSDRVTFLAAYRRWKCASSHPRRHVALWMLVNDKNGISSYEVHRALKVTQKTAWFLLHRLRLAMSGSSGLFSGQVEGGETYIRPDARKMHAKRRARLSVEKRDDMRYVSKAIGAGLLDRAKGRVYAQIVPNVR
jgi:hypothetical protein